MSLHSLGIPDLPERAFMRDARGHIMPQSKGSKPSTPNYEQLAREQAAGNLEMAKYAAQANRVNQVTPWGTLTWSNDRTFDQAGYDAAMAAYNAGNQGRWVTRYVPNPSPNEGMSHPLRERV